jgi:succinylglutamate desuccinylase
MNDCRDETVVGPRLHRFDHFPDRLLDVAASDLWRHLPGPSLFHIPGRHEPPLFISVLLHGNEDTGWRAVQTVLRRHRDTMLPRALVLFVGNIEAAKAGVRTLPTQTDYNRSWPGTPDAATPEARLMREVVEAVRSQTPFASIDIHNNTGNNPHYACLNSLDDPFLQLARLFSRTVVYFNKPVGVQSAALARLCPAVTVECGRVGGTAGIEHAAEFIASALAMSQFPAHPVPEADIDLLRTFAIVTIPPDASFSFDGADADFRLRGDLDHLNFSELDPGTSFGSLGGDRTRRLGVLPGADFAFAEHYFDYAGDEIRLARQAVPAMLTLDPDAVRLDCLGYLMHRIDRQGRQIID